MGVRVGTKLAVYEMLKTGTTTFNDMYFFGHVTADVVRKAGMRAVLAKQALIYKGDDDAYATDVKNNVDFCTKIADESGGMIHASMIPHAAYTVPEKQLKLVKAKYDEAFGGKPYIIHTHCHETQKEVDDFKG